jgi:hypothetical protein
MGASVGLGAQKIRITNRYELSLVPALKAGGWAASASQSCLSSGQCCTDRARANRRVPRRATRAKWNQDHFPANGRRSYERILVEFPLGVP